MIKKEKIMNEKWVKWKISEVIDHKYYIKLIKQDENGLNIILADSRRNPEKKKAKIIVKFDCTIPA